MKLLSGKRKGRPRYRSALLIAAITLLLVQPFCHGALAQETIIDSLAVTNSNRDLLLYFSLQNGFTPQLETGIQNGIPATFNFEARLMGPGQEGKEVVAASRTFSHTVTYDSLKEEFQVRLTEKGDAVLSLKNFDDAKALMAEICGVPIAPLASLEPGGKYVLRVRASLVKKTLPLNVHYLIPFWKAWGMETEWYSVTFRFNPAEP